MTSAVLERPVEARAANGGAPARRAVMRWAWRLFRREWRQQLLVLALIIVAVAALFVAAAVATNNPTPANVGFGSAKDLATFEGPVPHLAAKVAALERRFGRVEVIENETLTIPGTTETYQLRAESSHGPFSGPMLSLVSGRYPSAAGEVALTQSVASAFNLRHRVELVRGWRHSEGRRDRRGPARHPRRIRARRAGSSSLTERYRAALRCPGCLARFDRAECRRPLPGVVEQCDQPRDDHRHGRGARDGAHRARLGRRVHGARAASPALARLARRERCDDKARAARRADQRRHRRRRRNGHRRRDRTRRVADLPPDDRGDRAPCDRHVPTSLDRDRSRDGTRHRRDVSRRSSPGEDRRHGAGA